MYYTIINNIIKNELDKGQRIAFYPFGKIGMQANDILEARYGRRAILIDNEMKKYNPKIMDLVDFTKVDSADITIILCTSKVDLNIKLMQQIEDMHLKAFKISILQKSCVIQRKEVIFCTSKRQCVLQRKAEKCGLFSFFIVFLGGINYCIKNNLIPVVDMLSYENVYQGGEKINSWELFFEQPMGICLMEVENPIYINCNEISDYPNDSMDFLTNNKKLSYWRRLCKKYIRFNDISEQYIKKCMEKYMPRNRERETVGVLCRGTDYTGIKPYGHPVQPDAKELIAKVSQFMEKYQCKYVYLATEDKKICDIFSGEFGENLIVPDMERYENTGKSYLADVIQEHSDIYKKGMDYLASIYILSRCKCLVAGRTSGSVGAMILSEGYDEVYLWNEGYYGFDE